MNTDTKHIDNLIQQYCEKTANKAEQAELLNWVNASKENKEAFTQSVALYRKLSAPKADSKDAMWEEIATVVKQQKKSIALWKYASIAAACVIGFILSYTFIFNSNQNTQHLLTITAPDSILQSICPDSSEITLNTGSTLTLLDGFGKNHRNTEFDGYGYFSIKHNSQKPFTTIAGFVKVEVLGTKFCINKDSLGRFIEVSLFEGSVKCTDLRNNTSTILEPGKQAVYYTQSDKQTVVQTLEHRNPLVWKTGMLKFKNAPFTIAIPQIEEFFGKTIMMNDSAILDKTMYGKFIKEDEEDLPTMFNFSFGLDVETKNDTILLSSKEDSKE